MKFLILTSRSFLFLIACLVIAIIAWITLFMARCGFKSAGVSDSFVAASTNGVYFRTAGQAEIHQRVIYNAEHAPVELPLVGLWNDYALVFSLEKGIVLYFQNGVLVKKLHIDRKLIDDVDGCYFLNTMDKVGIALTSYERGTVGFLRISSDSLRVTKSTSILFDSSVSGTALRISVDVIARLVQFQSSDRKNSQVLSDSVGSLCFAPNGGVLVVEGGRSVVRITSEERRTLFKAAIGDSIRFMTINSDGNIVSVVSGLPFGQGSRIDRIDVQSGKLRSTKYMSEIARPCVYFGKDANTLMSSLGVGH